MGQPSRVSPGETGADACPVAGGNPSPPPQVGAPAASGAESSHGTSSPSTSAGKTGAEAPPWWILSPNSSGASKWAAKGSLQPGQPLSFAHTQTCAGVFPTLAAAAARWRRNKKRRVDLRVQVDPRCHPSVVTRWAPLACKVDGHRIVAVASASPAYMAGLREGDLVVESPGLRELDARFRRGSEGKS